MSLVSHLYPDQIVEYIVQELAYEGLKGISFDKLWELVSLKVKVDDFYKNIIYSWLSKNDNIELLDRNDRIVDPKPNSYSEVKQSGHLLRVAVEFQWVSLTGSPKVNNPIGGMAFDLLVEIAKSRHEGIDSFTLTKITGQDARSLTSRFKTLGPLVQKIPIIRNRRTLSLLILTKFYDPKKFDTIAVNKSNDDIMVSSEDVRSRIIGSLKSAKHGIRQLSDLRREMEMDKSDRIKRVFRSCINYLAEKGYLDKVLVVSPVAPKRKFSSLKYLKDYVPKAERNQDEDDIEEEDEEVELNEELIADELKDLETEEPPTSLSNVETLEIKSSEDISETPIFNRVFPFQNQVYEIVDETETIGSSSTEILESIFGPSYTRLFSKLIESYTSGKLLPYIANHGIQRHYDFKGRVKFYRYLTRPNFLKFSNSPLDAKGSILPQFEPSKFSIGALNKKNYIPLNTGVDLIQTSDGSTSIFWFGHSANMDSATKAAHRAASREARTPAITGDEDTGKKKRGRPKKGEVRELQPKKQKTKKLEDKQSEENVTIDETNKAQHTTENSESNFEEPQVVQLDSGIVENLVEEPHVLKVADLQGPSFKAIERLSGILTVLEKNSGVYENDFPLLDAVRAEIKMNVDKRTFKRDIQSLIAQHKIYIHEFFVGRENPKMYSLVVNSSASEKSIRNFENIIKGKREQKPTLNIRRLDELQDVEIDFFDNDLEKSFNEVPQAQAPKKQKKRKSSHATDIVSEIQKESVPKAKTPVKKDIKTEPKKKTASEPRPKRRPIRVKQETQSTDWDSSAKKARRSHGTRKKRNASHLNSSETMLLFKAVIICKTINENQINWEKIATLFDDISEEVLRKKWPRIRMMMGPEGSKSARRTWKRILLASVREGKITLPEVEELELESLVKLWQDAEMIGGVEETHESLYANYEENFAHYNFVKNTATSNSFSYDSNSMIQREQYLIGKSFTYVDEPNSKAPEPKEVKDAKSTIRSIIIAILASGSNANIKKLPLLDSFEKQDIDNVFVEMTRKKEVLIASDSKVLLGETLTHILDDNPYDVSLQGVNNFHSVLKELFEANKGLALDPIFENSFMVPIIELLNQRQLDIVRVDHYRREVLIGYEARTLEREKLDCDIILSKGTEPIKDAAKSSPLVPMGKPCSRIWVNVEGQINKPVWFKVNKAVLTSILSQPGITITDLHRKLSALLTKSELSEIIGWLKEADALSEKEFEGLWLCPQWYTVFAV